MGKRHYCWVILGCSCAVIGIAFGLINNVTGLFLAAICEDLGFARGELSFYFTISSIVMVVLTPFVGNWLPKTNVRVVMIVAVFLLAACFVGFSFGSAVYHWWLIAPFIGISSMLLAVPTIPTIIRNWFGDDYGFALGLAMAFSGIGGVVLTPVISKLISVWGWRISYRLAAIGCILILVPVCILIRFRPEDKGLSAYRKQAPLNVASPISDVSGVTKEEALHMGKFYMMLILTATLFFTSSMNQHMIFLASGKGLTYEQGTASATLLMGIILSTRLLLGKVCDRIGVFRVVMACSLTGAVGVAILLLTSTLTTGVFYFTVVLYGISIGMTSLANPQITSALFGKKNYSEIYAYSSMIMSLVGAVGMSINGALYDFVGNYSISLLLVIICFGVNILLSIILKKKAPWEFAGE